MAVWLATSNTSEGLINADRFLGRTVLTSVMFMLVCYCGRSVNRRARSIRLFDATCALELLDCSTLNLAPQAHPASIQIGRTDISAVQISRRALVRGLSFQCKHAPVRIAYPFIMIAHVIGSYVSLTICTTDYPDLQ
jgi:hypothetical protein